MKSIIPHLLFFLALFLCTGCEEEETLTIAEVSPVEALYAPEDNRYFNLGAQGSALFQWQAARAADNGVVLYEVAFDMEGGDFSDPLYVVASDGRGFENQLSLSFTELNQVATLAGIQPESTGKLLWTVRSTKGLNIRQAEEVRTIEVERPGGFPTPDELFLTGSATEGGTDPANAIPLVKTGADTYEVYTSLQPGTYHFLTRTSGTPEVFSIEGSDLRADGETTVTGEEQVYRIRVDFSDGSVSMATVDKVELWFPPRGEYSFAFDYVGNGTWEAADETIEFKQESWGRDERYKFKFTVTQDGNTTEEWYGSTNGDNQRPDANTGEEYWYVVPVTDDYWANSFKYPSEADLAAVDMRIIFNAEVPEYTHTITVQ
ncbi:SusE domain-containing protein [Lewinella sp. IMCC34183]|uniref:SusE domain-containing protein n=1 Tax=Lewinella sp. IMCC34183 TaxID=2248762 RepID=UPI000E2589BB|nr:SusE domain-containing protein [Lewinella sp. IMCC34183]